MTDNLISVWVFTGQGAKFPSGVFASENNANKWIKKYRLSGTLTECPLNLSAYEWAIMNNFFSPDKEHETSKEFIQKFTSASQRHYHYEDGERD